jgi:pyridoxamine 5'-phosphate oxidase
MSAPIPSFYDDLDGTLAEAWRLISRGVADRRSPFHHPVVATIGGDGAPQARTVILRACDPAAQRLRFHTDARSAIRATATT